MQVSTDAQKIEEVLTRGVDKIYPSPEALKEVLLSGRRIRLYNGIDPTGTELTLGHAVVLRKLEQFRALGHEVILLIGDFTGRIGDPSGKVLARKPLTAEEVRLNAKNYKKQAKKILKFNDTENPVKLMYNSKWWLKMKVLEFLELSYMISAQRLLERDMFQERMKRGEEITFAEMAYPILQGYDSVAMEVDLEIGGSDQTFNMLVGRRFVKRLQNREKFVLTVPLLTDASGRKIGKTEGNVIGLADKPEDLYGKIMALGDDAILPVFELCTDVTTDEIKKMGEEMRTGANPRGFKARLAETIVADLHSKAAAKRASKNFDRVFKGREAPEQVETVGLARDKWNIVELLVEVKLASSKSEARRLIEQGGIKVDGHALEGVDTEVFITEKGILIQRGKRHFVKVLKK